eukprot:TRINITY_DN6671_c0_g1_i1.p2 TRINITY_DN6671_c0_g1~~TRINITY_DN6671_c0_g1_i1.p2  ORF type:complete len:486 (+),score=131.50 TRINITY_DN6671_c0_g1_i1:1587-3044(+)
MLASARLAARGEAVDGAAAARMALQAARLRCTAERCSAERDAAERLVNSKRANERAELDGGWPERGLASLATRWRDSVIRTPAVSASETDLLSSLEEARRQSQCLKQELAAERERLCEMERELEMLALPADSGSECSEGMWSLTLTLPVTPQRDDVANAARRAASLAFAARMRQLDREEAAMRRECVGVAGRRQLRGKLEVLAERRARLTASAAAADAVLQRRCPGLRIDLSPQPERDLHFSELTTTGSSSRWAVEVTGRSPEVERTSPPVTPRPHTRRGLPIVAADPAGRASGSSQPGPEMPSARVEEAVMRLRLLELDMGRSESTSRECGEESGEEADEEGRGLAAATEGAELTAAEQGCAGEASPQSEGEEEGETEEESGGAEGERGGAEGESGGAARERGGAHSAPSPPPSPPEGSTHSANSPSPLELETCRAALAPPFDENLHPSACDEIPEPVRSCLSPASRLLSAAGAATVYEQAEAS